MSKASESLDPTRVTITDVQFVGTNVQMTWRVERQGADDRTVETAAGAVLSSKLGLHAVTVVGGDDGAVTLSVWASPLERLFHAIGPKEPLTIVKYASTTLDLSDVNLDRQLDGLVRSYPMTDRTHVVTPDRPSQTQATMTPWDTGKLLGTVVRQPHILGYGDLHVADVPVEPGSFPTDVLAVSVNAVAAHGGVPVRMSGSLLDAWGSRGGRAVVTP